jgi:hypothetical protein
LRRREGNSAAENQGADDACNIARSDIYGGAILNFAPFEGRRDRRDAP